ncbi:hypothetical protein DSO57_1032265 [Entomophthora muscae]|uniref:Uncharacterized protein n=1 Tax=Entomophthora muscae TaxID=34485 RepID=A0ACC2SDC0_9FUNG|nr:hypothetical protein DSO57_1032265 [Entomophthora muscae]
MIVIEKKYNIWQDLVEPKVNHSFITQDDDEVQLTPVRNLKTWASGQQKLGGGIRHGVRIDNYFPLETRAQEWDLNPDPDSLRAAGLHFLGTDPPQSEAPAKSKIQNTSTGLTMVVPEEELPELSNEGRESFSVNFMNLKSSWVTNQIQLSKKNTGFRPNPVTTAQNQENQVTNLDILTNERISSQGAILPLLHLGLLATHLHFPQYFDEALMENTKLGVQDLLALLSLCPQFSVLQVYPLAPSTSLNIL